MNKETMTNEKAKGRTWQDVAMTPSSAARRVLEANVLACFTTRAALPSPLDAKPVGAH